MDSDYPSDVFKLVLNVWREAIKSHNLQAILVPCSYAIFEIIPIVYLTRSKVKSL